MKYKFVEFKTMGNKRGIWDIINKEKTLIGSIVYVRKFKINVFNPEREKSFTLNMLKEIVTFMERLK